jgi:hypothetical protein
MKSNEFMAEGIADIIANIKTRSNLATQSRANWIKQQTKRFNPTATYVDRVTPKNLTQVARKMATEWHDYAVGQGLDKKPQLVYNKTLQAWLESMLRGQLSKAGINQAITTKTPMEVRDYLTYYVLPDKLGIQRPSIEGPDAQPRPPATPPATPSPIVQADMYRTRPR